MLALTRLQYARAASSVDRATAQREANEALRIVHTSPMRLIEREALALKDGL